MALPQLQHEQFYTFADYMTWDEGRWELINGEVWDMTPAPSRVHQDVSGALFNALYDFFKGNDCKVYAAPFDVRLPESDNAEDDALTTVVQPDISVICDPEKLDDRGCIGAPDLIAEILSSSTAARDLKVKRALYEKHGVNEYWLFHPTDKIVMVYLLDEEKQYGKAQILDKDDVLRSVMFEDFEVVLAHIFQEN